MANASNRDAWLRWLAITIIVAISGGSAAADPQCTCPCTRIANQAPQVRDEMPQPSVDAKKVFELYVTVGKALKKLSDRDPDATQDLMPRYRYINVMDAVQDSRKRRITAQRLRELQRIIIARR